MEIDPALYKKLADNDNMPDFDYPHQKKIETDLDYVKQFTQLLSNPFAGYFKSKLEPTIPLPFKPQDGVIYHGTSTDALDLILESHRMLPPIHLIKSGNLVYGELKSTSEPDELNNPGGPKFLSRKVMLQMGMLDADDPDLFKFGHAYDVCFGHVGCAASYMDKNPEKSTILGIFRRTVEFCGSTFLDGGSEGLLHEGCLDITFPLAQLLVPDAQVDKYRDVVDGTYNCQVYPMSQLTESSNK